MLCERGIRSFGDETRFVLDLAGAIWAQQRTKLPVIIDPSHATGTPALIGPLCLAAAAAGLDGVIVEVHPDPESALSDGDQALTFVDFENIVRSVRPVAAAVGRNMG